MASLTSRLKALVFGDRDDRLTIPIMDGALKPNNLLEEAPVLVERAGLEDLALAPDGSLFAACGQSVFNVAEDGALTETARFDRDITALAVLANGGIAVAHGNTIVIDRQGAERRTIDRCDGRAFVAINALQTTPTGTLLITDGSTEHPYERWSHDLLEKGRTGRIVEYDPVSTKVVSIASGLAYAFGASAGTQDQTLVSESWDHRIRAVQGSSQRVVIAGLPGYPARMSPAASGGFWLCLFACRTQLVEFVLCEDDFRREMIRTIDPRYWIVPALSSGHDFLEPLQGGGVKQMGILKPWAPPRSYGLVIHYGPDFIPRHALHSRVGGRNHGIVAAVERAGSLYVLSKGAGRILKLPASATGDEVW
jgi:hypothetical protein